MLTRVIVITQEARGYRASVCGLPIGRLRKFYCTAKRDAKKIAEASRQTHANIEIRDFVSQKIVPVQNLAGGY